jgi:LAS superfamily LD-carboxypeptidase LdcB
MPTGKLTRETQRRGNLLLRALRRRGALVRVTSTWRSRLYQAKLYSEWLSGLRTLPAARPGSSLHETGMAFDISARPDVLAWAGSLAPSLGLRWGGTFRNSDPVHFELR